MKQLVALLLLTLAMPVLAQQEVIEEVIVKINDEMISRTEFEESFEPLRRQLADRFEGEELQKNIDNYRKRVFNIMVNKRLLKVKFNEMGGRVPQSEYDEMKRYFMNQTKSENDEQLEQALRDAGFSMGFIRQLAEERYINRMIFGTELREDFELSESDIQEYYEANAERYKTEEKVSLSQIVYTYSTGDKEVVKSLAQDALDRIKAGEDFDAVYREVNSAVGEDDSASIGTVELDSLRFELQEVARELEVGEVSDPIDLGTLFVILKLDDRQEAEMIPLEEIRNQLRQDMQAEIVEDGLDRVILRFKREFLIEIKAMEFAQLYEPASTDRELQRVP